MANPDATRERLRRRAFALANELALDDHERRELAMMLPGQRGSQEPVSWKVLDEEDFATLVLWLDGASKVTTLYRLRP